MTRRVLFAVTILCLAAAGAVSLGAQKAQPKAVMASAVPDDPDHQTVLHVLNRVAYGPRPGDIARVRGMGLAAYIDQQLHPERVNDPVTDAALAAFPTLTMSTAELAEKYYRPLEEMRRNEQQKKKTTDGKEQMAPDQQALRQSAASVLQNLMQARMVRAVMSERQLNEVLVDFWFNHFNVYAQKGTVKIGRAHV